MFRVSPPPLQLVLLAGALFTAITSLVLPAWLPGWRWHHEPLHAAMEALGGLCAIVMGIVLFRPRDDQADRWTRPLALGFVGMGVLEEFHAVSTPGNAFILLRSLASLWGSIGFVLVWRSTPETGVLRRPWLPVLAGAGAVTIGWAVVAWRTRLPEMMLNGEFAPVAVAPTSLAAMLFFAAAVWFLREHRRTGSPESYLFCCLALLFGLAEVMFTYSLLWDARWWFWHLLRLMAYTLVLGYMVSGYRHMVRDLQASLAQTRRAEEAARSSEQHLRDALEARERLAQDLHDGIIQSLFALGLSLERCQRLAPKDPDIVAAQLGQAAVELKRVIRDLRGYLAGADPITVDGRELEAALVLQARMMASSHDLQVALHVDPRAAASTSPEQATHLLFVAREALSNCLRHAQAHRAALTLEVVDHQLRLVVEDDGLGFEPAAHTEGGSGLKNMAARAVKVGGRLDVTSAIGGGTRVALTFPMEGVHA
ncbi:sensor histidine kinase [Candidatus Nitrospira bockiana]